MKHNLSMAALMFDFFNTNSFVTYIMSGTPHMDVLDDPKYILNGEFYYTNTLLTDLALLGNTVLAKQLSSKVDATVAGELKLISSTPVSVVANGEATWFISMVRRNTADINSPSYSVLVHTGTVGTDSSFDLVVGNPHLLLGSPVQFASRKIRIAGYEQSS